jgi:hypothetical protein
MPQGSNERPRHVGQATWQRYLVAAARLEPDYMPRMRRLQQDIDRFERLLTLPMTAAPAQ